MVQLKTKQIYASAGSEGTEFINPQNMAFFIFEFSDLKLHNRQQREKKIQSAEKLFLTHI